MASPLLEVRSVTVRFGGVMALNDVSFDVEEGEGVALVGANGAGKSTMVGVVSGAQRCRPGSVRFAGVDVTRAAPHTVAALGLARTFQIVQPFSGLTARECTALGAMYGATAGRRVGARDVNALADEALEFVGLTAFAEQPTDSLNAAQRRMLEIARAVAARPRLILLDEVLSGLNSAEIQRGLGLVNAILAKGTAVIMIEHVVQAVAGVAKRIVVLDQGGVIVDGPAAEVLQDERAVSAYFGVTR